MQSQQSKSIRSNTLYFVYSHKKLFNALSLIFLFILGVFLVYIFLPVHVTYQPGVSWYAGVDWKNSFRPATLAFYSLKTPYIPGTFNPPWAFIPLLPIALLPPDLGAAIIFVLNLFVIGLVAYRLKAKPVVIVAILLSPVALIGSFNANIDWMVALALISPPSVGIFLALVKPQIGFLIAVFLIYEAWRKGGFWSAFRLATPVAIIFSLSLLAYGFWPFTMLSIRQYGMDWGVFPIGIPIGLTVFVISLRSHRIGLAAVASPFLAPYVAAASWIVPILGLLPFTLETLAAVLGLWIAQIMGVKFLPFL